MILGASAICLVFVLVSCGGSSSKVPEYVVLEHPQVDLTGFTKDEEGFIVLFDGVSMDGWRGYGREDIPARWIIDDEAIKFTGTGEGEGQRSDGGDLIFGHKFKNFELSVDWKCSLGANSGILYLGQEIKGKSLYLSAPESQVLDNENHGDAKLGKDGNRQSSSLYDMIPAKPQNANPYDEWNNTTIIVNKGKIIHKQNGISVVEYQPWTPQWTALLKDSKFSPDRDFPDGLAFELLNNLGGVNREGFIGLQDHGNDVWFRNIRIKILD